MKSFRVAAIFFALMLVGCGTSAPRTVTVIDGTATATITTREKLPILILAEAGITPQPVDRVLVNGIPYALDESIDTVGDIKLELRRAVSIKIISPGEEREILSSALTIGEVLREEGIEVNELDEVLPPIDSPINGSLTIQITPKRELTVTIGEETITIRSAAVTIGEALAEAGIPLIGLDRTVPAENEAIPPNGQIKVIRVSEVILAEVRSIPFPIEERYSEDIPFGQQEILQNGVIGAAIVRTRVRYEDGVEVSRETESERILRKPVTQIVASGSKITFAPAGGEAPYPYWYATEMYATWYSPCNSGTGSCSYGTASGARAGFGIVAVDYSIYSYLAGMRVYIPGYGVATIGDTGGGPIVETAFGVARTQWIDLGYDDNNIGGLSGWVTVYFLEPAPAEIPYFFR
jgi:uncharacterized protein YabE (DUF348 family)